MKHILFFLFKIGCYTIVGAMGIAYALVLSIWHFSMMPFADLLDTMAYVNRQFKRKRR